MFELVQRIVTAIQWVGLFKNYFNFHHRFLISVANCFQTHRKIAVLTQNVFSAEISEEFVTAEKHATAIISQTPVH